MGPRPDGRGRRTAKKVPTAATPASMGPRPDGRGRRDGMGIGPAGGLASMGPRPDGRGRCRVWGRCCATKRGVNGAAAGWPRKGLCVAPAAIDLDPASMGPRPDGRGRMTIDFNTRPSLSRQWGRGRMAAEGRVPRRPADRVYQASMGPRPDGRGRRNGRVEHRSDLFASMGPRPDGRGRMMPGEWTHPHATRQWGRGRMAAEGALAAQQAQSGYTLRQWGRGRMAAEGMLTG